MSRRIKKSSIKFLIPLVLMFMLVGFATISTTLSINGDMELLSDLDDFNIYYSRAIVNGVEDPSIIKSSTELDFGTALKTVGVDYVIEYDITNASSAFDAQVSINCSASTEYFSINNEFDSETPIGARQTRTGTMTLRKIQTVAGDEQSNIISCDIVATPVERNEEGVGEIPIPLENPYYIGREISIGEEKFNIISDNGDTITMLAQYNIGTDNKQSEEENYVIFSESNGWEYEPGPKEIDIQQYDGQTKTLLNNYVSSLKTEYGVVATGDLITVEKLGNLGCTVPTDYVFVPDASTRTCTDSPYKSWLVNGQKWWTRSVRSGGATYVFIMLVDGILGHTNYYGSVGMRPTITISKEVAEQLLDVYPVGKEISIGEEKFYVISDNGTTISMLAQFNLGEDYKQSEVANAVSFSDEEGWENKPGPQEIDIQVWSTNLSAYINNYVSYLAEEYGVSVIGNLITLKELKNLDCSIEDDYSLGVRTCDNSIYKSWIFNGQYWWTRSASSDYETDIWYVKQNSGMDITPNYDENGVRPVITISKETLVKLYENTIITFTIDGTEYKAYEGMTWAEWIDSGFNVNGTCVSDYGWVRFQCMTFIYNKGAVVKTEDVIVNNELLTRENAGGAD